MGSRHIQIGVYQGETSLYELICRSRADTKMGPTYYWWTKRNEKPNPMSELYLTCRQIYLETQSLLYSSNVFSFEDFGLHQAFLLWKSRRDVMQTNSVQRIVLTMFITKTLDPRDLMFRWQGLKTVYLVTSPYHTLFSTDERLTAAEKHWHNTGVEVVYLEQHGENLCCLTLSDLSLSVLR